MSCGALVVSTNIHASRLMFAERPVLVPAPSCCSFPSQKLASAPPCSLPSLSCFLLVFHLATSLYAPGLINEDLSSFPIVKTCPGPMVYSVPLSHYTRLERQRIAEPRNSPGKKGTHKTIRSSPLWEKEDLMTFASMLSSCIFKALSDGYLTIFL